MNYHLCVLLWTWLLTYKLRSIIQDTQVNHFLSEIVSKPLQSDIFIMANISHHLWIKKYWYWCYSKICYANAEKQYNHFAEKIQLFKFQLRPYACLKVHFIRAKEDGRGGGNKIAHMSIWLNRKIQFLIELFLIKSIW